MRWFLLLLAGCSVFGVHSKPEEVQGRAARCQSHLIPVIDLAIATGAAGFGVAAPTLDPYTSTDGVGSTGNEDLSRWGRPIGYVSATVLLGSAIRGFLALHDCKERAAVANARRRDDIRNAVLAAGTTHNCDEIVRLVENADDRELDVELRSSPAISACLHAKARAEAQCVATRADRLVNALATDEPALRARLLSDRKPCSPTSSPLEQLVAHAASSKQDRCPLVREVAPKIFDADPVLYEALATDPRISRCIDVALCIHLRERHREQTGRAALPACGLGPLH